MDNDTLISMSLLYFVNMPSVLQRLFSVFLSLLNEKYKDLVSQCQRQQQDQQNYLHFTYIHVILTGFAWLTVYEQKMLKLHPVVEAGVYPGLEADLGTRPKH